MASTLDRAVWLLSHRSDLWEALGPQTHALLIEQPAPHGAFFSWLDRLVHDQGPLSRAALLAELGRDDAAPGLGALAGRVGDFHDMPAGEGARAEIDVIVDRMRLLAVQGELDLLATSEGLSDTARTRQRALLERQRDLKDRLSRPRDAAG
jgi:DNA primase